METTITVLTTIMICTSLVFAYTNFSIIKRKKKIAHIEEGIEKSKDEICEKLGISRGQLQALYEAHKRCPEEFSALCETIEKRTKRKPRTRRANKHLKK